ncbi:DUF1540 domain-containing protein [Niameybacter massiliensis]|uniref:DUF1540 domain-containing protein n=1 Tax=Niameybacter massiliensis TaxID=1658108 RepID=UPI0006B6607D|nr:DUF1540 domain-containing protein [Niameybacter massiliensis]
MPKVSCSVESCYYNNSSVCQAERLQVGGEGASITEATYCESYTSKQNARNAIEQVGYPGQTETICCDVNTCMYNSGWKCSLNEIEISSLCNVSNYAHTDCLSFERNS